MHREGWEGDTEDEGGCTERVGRGKQRMKGGE